MSNKQKDAAAEMIAKFLYEFESSGELYSEAADRLINFLLGEKLFRELLVDEQKCGAKTENAALRG